jgi:putative tryptophan/tyrosine transport system substrate-binding protein
MRRRDFIMFVSGATAALPLAALAQSTSKLWRVGFIAGGSRPASLDASVYGGFLKGMSELGQVEGKDFAVEWRFADGRYNLFPTLAAELVHIPVDVLVVGTPAAVKPVQQAAGTIPIVMGTSIDPVGAGLINSLAHPGGNTTGLASSQEDICVKQLDLLRMAVPALAGVGFVQNPDNPFHTEVLKILQRTAPKAGLKVQAVEMQKPEDIESGFAKLKEEGVGAVLFTGDGFLFAQRRIIASAALKVRLPTIFGQREYVDAGGLMSYGNALADLYRRAAFYVDRILHGARPRELPVQQPTNFETVINRKTAEALGLSLPIQLLVLADQVID